MPVDGLAELRAGQRAADADDGEEGGAAPAHMPGACVGSEVEKGGDADRGGTGADGQMRAADADDVEQQRRR